MDQENPTNRRPRILVVDDDRPLCEVLFAWLSKSYDVEFAHDGEEALRRVRDRRPDLVLLDVMMPRLSGFSVAWVFRNDERYRGIPVVFMTAHADHMAEARRKLAQADDHVLKPFSMKRLAEVLRRHLPEALLDLGLDLPATGEGSDPADRRLAPRVAVDLPANVECMGVRTTGRVLSLSHFGAYLACDADLGRGVLGVLHLDAVEKGLGARFEVVYEALRDGERGIGVNFVDLSASQQEAIDDLLTNVTATGRP